MSVETVFGSIWILMVALAAACFVLAGSSVLRSLFAFACLLSPAAIIADQYFDVISYEAASWVMMATSLLVSGILIAALCKRVPRRSGTVYFLGAILHWGQLVLIRVIVSGE